MGNYTKNDELFSTLDKSNEGISIISKINQNNSNTFKLVDVVDIDWNGAIIYTENESGNSIENKIEDSSEIINILQDTINKVGGDKTLDINTNCSILENSKVSMYLINNEYMKIDYYGSTVFDTTINQFNYSSEYTTQHFYVDKNLTTFIPGLPYQNPFKSVVAFKMPLAFDSNNKSYQKIVMCQDFIWGDEQNDHNVMCPRWASFLNGFEWNGENSKGLITKYTSDDILPIVSHSETIDVYFGDNVQTVNDELYSSYDETKISTEIFTQVKSTDDLTALKDDDFILVYKSKTNSNNNVAAWQIGSTGKYYQQIGVSLLENNDIVVGNSVLRFKIELADNYSVSNPKVYLKEKVSGKYINYTEKDLDLSATGSDFWLLSFDSNNNALFKTYATNYTLGYNVSSPRFKPYTLDGKNLDYIQLYHLPATSEKISPELEWTNKISYKELKLSDSYQNICRTNLTSNLSITYNSSNTNVATVDSTGKLTLIGIGSAIISATSMETETYLSETIQYQINVIQDFPANKILKYFTAFIYPLITITDNLGHVYSPLLISFIDENKQKINEKYIWMESTDSINILNRSLNNLNYKQNNINFINEHIKQLNRTFIGNNCLELPADENKLKSSRIKTWKDSDDDKTIGQLQPMDSIIGKLIKENNTIELNTIDEDGHIISCGVSNSFNELYNNFSNYKTYAQGKINQVYIEKYPWLF